MKLALVLAASVALGLGLGCHSTPNGEPAPLASVVLQGNTPGQIRNVAEQVFGENGYTVAQTKSTSLVLEKRAGKMSNLAYGSWLGDDPVWVRVKVAIVPAGEMTFRVQCNARLVTDRGGPTEEEIKSGSLRRAPYQKLLEEVARRLQSPDRAGSAGISAGAVPER